MKKKSAFMAGLVDGLPICFGYLSVSFAFGIFAVGSGLTVWETLFISMTNVTSAGQLAAVPIITLGGTLAELASSQFVINLRYALMSISLSQRLDGSMTLPHRLAVAFVNTDEVFAVAASRPELVGKRYLYGLILTPYLGWSTGTLVGAAVGDLLPAFLTSALGIAIYGMFLAIIIPKAREDRPTAVCVVLAAVLSCLFRYVPLLSRVPSGFVIIICAVAASVVMAIVSPIPEKAQGESEVAEDA
ncbi:MAG: AzlC family ABC transporter permease [Oscillospiraceae bacterium]|nr:AzlC family ABC transporter permease [Oscillospiraceae bacterium]